MEIAGIYEKFQAIFFLQTMNKWNLHETFQMYHSNDLNIRINKTPTLARLFLFSDA